MTLPPYPEYKDSGVDWLGEIPTHWDISPLKRSVDACINGIWGSDPTGLDDTLCVRVADFDRFSHRVKLNKPTMRSIPQKQLENRLLQPGDLLLEKSGGGDLQPVGVVILYDYDIPAVCSNFIARMPVASGFVPTFLVYLHAALYSKKINVRSIKQTTGIQNLDSKQYLAEVVAFPPPDEQAAIVRFLDAAEARIRRYIRAKQKLIKLLNEQKQAIIQQAVTRGLDPDAPMKDSGIEWLGEIPAHWQTIKLKFLVSTLGGMTPSKSESNYWDGDIPWVSPKDMKVDVIKDSQDHITQLAVDETNISIVPSGSLLMVVRGMILARRVPVAVTACPVTINQDMKALVAKTGLRSDYLRLMFQGLSPVLLFFVEESGHGTRKFPTENWANLHLPIPNVDEQEIILEHIQNNTFELDEITKQNEAQIDLIREYRTRLIANVVTGKVDVRGLAFEMPEAFDERDLLDVDEDEVFEEDEFEGITDE